MTKNEWRLHHRQVRMERPKTEITLESCASALKDLYGFMYTERQYIFIRLACKYNKMLPKSYFDKIESWKPEAKIRSKEYMKNLIYSKNPFLSLVAKNDSFSVCYVPIPIVKPNE